MQIGRELMQAQARHFRSFEHLRDLQDRINEYSDRHQELLATRLLAVQCREDLRDMLAEILAIESGLESSMQRLDQLTRNVFGVPAAKPLYDSLVKIEVSLLERMHHELRDALSWSTDVSRRCQRTKAGGAVAVIGGLLLQIGGASALLGQVLLLSGTLLIAWATLRSTKVNSEVRMREQHIRRRLSETIPGSIDPLNTTINVLDDIKAIRILLAEVVSLESRVFTQRQRLVDLDNRTRGLASRAEEIRNRDDSSESWGPGDTRYAGRIAALRRLHGYVVQQVECWLAHIAEAEQRRQVAGEAGAQLASVESDTHIALRTLREREEALNEVATDLAELGMELPSNQDGGVQVEQLFQATRAQCRDTRSQLKRLATELAGATGQRHMTLEHLKELRQRIVEELQAMQGHWKAVLESVGADPPLARMDRPTERFLAYGGHWADQFVVAVLALLTTSLDAGQPSKPAGWSLAYRYARVHAAFCAWWANEGHDLCAKRIRRPPTPRMVAWREGGEWALGVCVPEALLDRPNLLVRQADCELLPAPREGCWYLSNLSDQVICRDSDFEGTRLSVSRYRHRDLSLVVCRGWEGDRRLLPASPRIGRPGRVTLFFPATWQLGSPLLVTEPVRKPAGLQACCVDFAEVGVVSFVGADGNPFDVDLGGGARFNLTGNTIFINYDHEQGSLFVGEHPRLRCIQEELLREVGWAELLPGGTRIGPSTEWLSEGVAVALQEPSGCFEIVIYDRQGAEMERLPFRYMSNLKEVRIDPNRPPVFPGPEGHPKVRLQFDVGVGCTVELREPYLKLVGREWTPIAPQPGWDRTVWELGSRGGRTLPFELLLQRAWWTAGECQHQPLSWGTSIVTVPQDWVQATSDQALWLRCQPGTVRRDVQAGFVRVAGDNRRNGDALRQYRFDRTGILEIPLREYCDHIATAPNREHIFRVCVQGLDGTTTAGQIAVYRPLAPTELCFFCVQDAPDVSREEKEEAGKCCATCSFCIQHFAGEVFCTKGQWEKRLNKEEFNRLMALNVCERWDGEYPGEPFGWEAAGLYKAAVKTKLPELFGAAICGIGFVIGIETGRICVRWDSPDATASTWLCRYHYHKYCEQMQGPR